MIMIGLPADNLKVIGFSSTRNIMSLKDESSDTDNEEFCKYIQRNLNLQVPISRAQSMNGPQCCSLSRVVYNSRSKPLHLSRTESMPLSRQGIKFRASLGKTSCGRRHTFTNTPGVRRHRRISEQPFYSHGINRNRKTFPPPLLEGKPQSRRRTPSVNSALQIPNSTKLKLQELAKDELLASLSVPTDKEEEDPIVEERDEVDNLALIEEEERRQLRELKRLKVIEEIFETEKKYIRSLETMDKVFRTPMQDGGIAAEKDVRALFPPCLSTIKECHSWFMNELENRINSDEWKGSIGDVFGNLSGPLKNNILEVYTNYVNAFPKSISTFSKCTRGSNKFRKFIEECYDKSDNLDLPSYLITPVQRLPRYVLLLRQLTKYTSDEHPDLDSIKVALQQMEELIKTLNGAIQSSMVAFTSRDTDTRRSFRRQLSKRRKKPDYNRKPTTADPSFKDGKYQEEKKPRTTSPTSPLSAREEKTSDRISSTVRPGLERREDGDVRRENKSEKRQHQRSASADSLLTLQKNPSSSPTHSAIVLRNKPNDLTRSSEIRKSWRRSIGTKLSALWSPKEERPEGSYRRRSEDPASERCNERKEKEKDELCSRDITDHSEVVRRKVGVANHDRPFSFHGTVSSSEEEDKLREVGSELNNNKRRKFSESFRDKTKTLKMNLKRRSLTLPAGITEDYILKSQGHVRPEKGYVIPEQGCVIPEQGRVIPEQGHVIQEQGPIKLANNTIIILTENQDVTEGQEQKLEDISREVSPNFKRNNKVRLSGRSSNLMSLFQKRKTKHSDDEVENPECTARGEKEQHVEDCSNSDKCYSPTKEEIKLNHSKSSSSKKNKVKKHEIKHDSNLTTEDNDRIDDSKNTGKSHESRGRWKRAFKSMVGKSKA